MDKELKVVPRHLLSLPRCLCFTKPFHVALSISEGCNFPSDFLCSPWTTTEEMEGTCQMAWGDPAWQDFPALKSRSPKRTAVIWGAPPCV